jgi:hypothetical protein
MAVNIGAMLRSADFRTDNDKTKFLSTSVKLFGSNTTCDRTHILDILTEYDTDNGRLDAVSVLGKGLSVVISGADLASILSKFDTDSYRGECIHVIISELDVALHSSDIQKVLHEFDTDSHKLQAVTNMLICVKDLTVNMHELYSIIKEFDTDSHRSRCLTTIVSKFTAVLDGYGLQKIMSKFDTDSYKFSAVSSLCRLVKDLTVDSIKSISKQFDTDDYQYKCSELLMSLCDKPKDCDKSESESKSKKTAMKDLIKILQDLPTAKSRVLIVDNLMMSQALDVSDAERYCSDLAKILDPDDYKHVVETLGINPKIHTTHTPKEDDKSRSGHKDNHPSVNLYGETFYYDDIVKNGGSMIVTKGDKTITMRINGKSIDILAKGTWSTTRASAVAGCVTYISDNGISIKSNH